MEKLERLQQALRHLQGDPAVAMEVQKLLAPLACYDRAHGSDLLLTLGAFLAEGGNVTATADRLFLHRNSVLYRLRRIEELSGLDVHIREVRDTFQMAYHLVGPETFAPSQES